LPVRASIRLIQRWGGNGRDYTTYSWDHNGHLVQPWLQVLATDAYDARGFSVFQRARNAADPLAVTDPIGGQVAGGVKIARRVAAATRSGLRKKIRLQAEGNLRAFGRRAPT
jgi:hypothetical protein